ncbi:MAG: hypothetical protein KGY42_08985 [Desulfobacterales bacterium]|nr:hypothetical protein [Desulfobacterales bacterium]MBS3755050.1 hypothetical protein [Desulfobacterales bacterium]
MAASVVRPDRPRAVVHLNITDFAVAVERLADRGLEGRPVIVAPEGAARARVFDMSEEAYQAGVRKAMPLYRARRICRDAAVLPPHPERYEWVMAELCREALAFSPLVEPGRIDGHFFVDITGTSRIFGPPADAARRMYRHIRQRLGLCPVWAVAENKLVSKVATRLVKPAGEYVVRPGEAGAFLSPLPVDLLPGVAPEDLARLRELNLQQICQVAGLTADELAVPFGSRAGWIHDLVHGIDPSPVRPAGEKAAKITASCEFGAGANDPASAAPAMYRVAEKIGAELRKRGKVARSLAIAIDYADGLRCFRQLGVQPPSADDITLFEVCRALLDKAWVRRVRLRRICVICAKPVAPQVQMELFSGNQAVREKRDAVIHAVDRVRQRFGAGAVSMGRTMAP